MYRIYKVLDGLQVYPENMEKNLQITGGAIFSQNVLNALLDSGFGRDEAYKLVQKCAMQARNEGKHFRDVLKSDAEIKQTLSPGIIDSCFKVRLLYVDEVFERLGIE
jgi:adenylosuccinate lyase